MSIDNSLRDVIAADLAAWAEVTCFHGNHYAFCDECDCPRRLAEAALFTDPQPLPHRVRYDVADVHQLGCVPDDSGPVVGVGDAAYVLGGCRSTRPADPDNFDADLLIDPCTGCWQIPARNGSCGC